jgi:hypothetical protein
MTLKPAMDNGPHGKFHLAIFPTMRFDKFIPQERLQPYIKYLVLSENELGNAYKVFPSAGLVIGFQYKGKLSIIKDHVENKLDSAGVTGIADSYKIFKNSPGTGTVLVYFTATGFTHFASHPANELFDLSLSLSTIFEKQAVNDTEAKLAAAVSDKQRIQIVEQFLLSQLKVIEKAPYA